MLTLILNLSIIIIGIIGVGIIVDVFVGSDCPDKHLSLFFRRFSVGLLLLTALYAMVITSGKTILAAAPVLLVVGLKWNKPSINGRWKPNAVVLALVGVTVIVLFFLRYLQINDLSGNRFVVHNDFSFYAALANAVANTAIESTTFDMINPLLQSPTMYHWGDIHLAGLGQLFVGNYLDSYLYIVCPLTGAVAVLGIGAVVEKYHPSLHTHTIALLSLTAFTMVWVGVAAGAYEPTVYIERFFDILVQRVYIPLAVICWMVIAKRKVFPLLIGSVIFSVIAPAALLGCGLYLLIVSRHRFREGGYWIEVVAVGLTTLWLIYFYQFTAVTNDFFESYIPIFTQIRVAFEQEGWVAVLIHVLLLVGILVAISIMFLLMRVAMSVENRKVLSKFFLENLIVMCYLTGGLFSSILFWFMRDGIQFLYGAIIPFYFLLVVLSLSLLWNSRQWWSKFIFVIVIMLSVATAIQKGNYQMTKVDTPFYTEFAQLSGNIGWVSSKAVVSTKDTFGRDPNYATPFTTVRRFRNNYFPLRLDVYDIEYKIDEISDYSVVAAIENSPFYRFVQINGLQKEIAVAQRRFIIENQIKHLILPCSISQEWLRERGFVIENELQTPRKSFSVYTITYADTIQ